MFGNSCTEVISEITRFGVVVKGPKALTVRGVTTVCKPRVPVVPLVYFSPASAYYVSKNVI